MAHRTYLDLPLDATGPDAPPSVGDIMLGARHAHRVVDIWPTDSRVWPNRWTVTLEPLGPYDPDHLPPIRESCEYRTWRTYRRGEGPREFFGDVVDRESTDG